MRLDQALVARGLAPSRARAQDVIRLGQVSVGGSIVSKPSTKVDDETELSVSAEAHDYVSRAALKLVGGLDAFGVDPSDLICLDLGASTGGFTDVLLRRGAKHVFAVDVGTDQFHPSLRDDRRVSSLEGTHAKHLSRDLIPRPIDLVVCDVSFISIVKALPPALALTGPAGQLVTLVKPQFELGP
ncbi:MAG: TlyA family RNA methyltransferase, partial [Pseudomonadota bacterium]